MNKITDILKPKSQGEIKDNLAQLVGITDTVNSEDLDYVLKLYHIVTILKSDKPSGTIAYMNFDPDHGWSDDMEEIDLGENTEHRAYTQSLTLNLYTKEIKIRKKIKSWKEIYEKTIAMIIENCENLSDRAEHQTAKYYADSWPVMNNFGFAANLIATKCRYGPANFAIVNSDFYEDRIDEFNNQDILKVIVDDTAKGKIIIGRKAGTSEAGIFLTKYKNKYSLDSTGVAKNNYISIDVASN